MSDDYPINITPDKKYPRMYRLEWENGDVSVRYWDGEEMPDGIPISSYGMYNLSRAKDILKNYREYVRNMTLRSQNPFTDALE